MRARSITSVARSPVLQSQATANFPGPSGRATSFQPVPWQNWQFSIGIVRTSIRARAADGKSCAVWNAVEEKRVTRSTQREEAQSLTEIGRTRKEIYRAKAQRRIYDTRGGVKFFFL